MEFIKRDPVIFLIAGKANSGKDTSAEFIDNYVKLKGLKVVNLQLSSYIKMYAKKISGWNGEEDSKPRSLLQELGTDIIRNKIWITIFDYFKRIYYNEKYKKYRIFMDWMW